MPTLLHFVEKSHPILREKIPKVVDFKDPDLHATIANMRYSILPPQLKAANGAHDGAAGMAANQWGIKKRVFLFTPDGSEEGKRVEAMINPSYIPYLLPGETEPTLTQAYEGCFSVPLTTGIVSRYEAIMATYYNEAGKKIQVLLKGWEARVFQHETDHLDGKLFDGCWDNFSGPECLERIIFKDKEEMDNYWTKEMKEERKK